MTTIKPTVTDEMIEKGREALTPGIMGCGQCCGDNPPDELDYLDFDVARAHVAARAVLEIAAPLIAAHALRDFAASMDSKEWEHRDDWGVNCAYAFEVLARADQIEAGRCCAHAKCPGGSLCCCTEEAGR